MALDLLTRDAAADRAHRPVGPPSSYTVTSVEVLPVLRPIRRIRAIRLSDSAKRDMMTMTTALPFIVLLVAAFLYVPLWAAIPGAAVISACMIITVSVLAHHEAKDNRYYPGKKR